MITDSQTFMLCCVRGPDNVFKGYLIFLLTKKMSHQINQSLRSRYMKVLAVY